MDVELTRLAAQTGRFIAINRLTQAEFAEKCGVSQSTVSRLLGGSATRMRRDSIRRIEQVIGIPARRGREVSPSDRSGESHRAAELVRIFVGGASDVEAEVHVIREVVDELNQTAEGHRLEVINWRSHAIPGVGQDAQAVINASTPQDYDVFVAVMWARFGTATGRAGSGTEEEIRRALASDRVGPNVLLYFKDKPLAPSEMDLDQLAAVMRFKAEFKEQGLYWDFSELEEFAKTLRIHLTRVSRRVLKERDVSPPTPTRILTEDQDFGLMDLQETVSDAFQRGTEATQRIAEYTETLGNRIGSRAAELDAVPRKHGNVDIKMVRRIGDNAAADMETFTERIETEMPIMRTSFETALDSIEKAVGLLFEFELEDSGELSDLLVVIDGLDETLGSVHVQIDGFRTIVSRTPRLTKSMAKARRRTVAALDQLLSHLESMRRVADVVRGAVTEAIAVI